MWRLELESVSKSGLRWKACRYRCYRIKLDRRKKMIQKENEIPKNCDFALEFIHNRSQTLTFYFLICWR